MAFVSPVPLHPSFTSSILSTRLIPHGKRLVPSRNRRATQMVADVSPSPPPFTAADMTVDDFFTRSFGEWKSQRSSHNLLWAQFEQITSEIEISSLSSSDPAVTALCEQNKVSPSDLTLSLRMTWEGESDWDEEEVLSGETVMSVIKDSPDSGRLLRSSGYAETIPAVGQWRMTPEGVFVLETPYEAAAAEERIWFATPDLRMRISQIRTSSGRGVVTASLSTEIRRLHLEE